MTKTKAALELEGWYWWACFPGCLPDSDPNGPFATKAQALADAQDCNDRAAIAQAIGGEV
jgi:hypothetical protein